MDFPKIKAIYNEYISTPLQQFGAKQKDKISRLVHQHIEIKPNEPTLSLIGRVTVQFSKELIQDILKIYDAVVEIYHRILERNLSYPILNPADMDILEMEGDGSCLFHSVKALLDLNKEYAPVKRSLQKFDNQVPESTQLRQITANYLKEKYNQDPKIRELVNSCLEEFNERSTFNARTKKLLRDTLNGIKIQLEDVNNTPSKKIVEEQIETLKKIESEEQFKIEAEKLKTSFKDFKNSIGNLVIKKSLEDVKIEETLSLPDPIDVNTYFEMYKNEGFFANRDALFALGQIFKVNFKVYIETDSDPDYLAFACSSLEPRLQSAPSALLQHVGGNHYDIFAPREISNIV